MNFLSRFLTGSFLSLSLFSPLHSHALPTQPVDRSPVENADPKEKFVATLRKIVLDKCNETAEIEDPLERFRSCECYIDSYIKRYTPESLVAINNWSSKNPGKGAIIVLMLQPERSKCKIP